MSPYLLPKVAGKISLSLCEERLIVSDTRRAAGRPCDRPNVAMNSNVHVCWKKAALYLEIENHYCIYAEKRYNIDPWEAVSLVDENNILIWVILGSTYTGHYEDVQALNDLIMRRKISIGIYTLM